MDSAKNAFEKLINQLKDDSDVVPYHERGDNFIRETVLPSSACFLPTSHDPVEYPAPASKYEEAMQKMDYFRFLSFYNDLNPYIKAVFAYHIIEALENNGTLMLSIPFSYNYTISQYLHAQVKRCNVLACIFSFECFYAYKGYWIKLIRPDSVPEYSSRNPLFINFNLSPFPKGVMVAGNRFHVNDFCTPFTGLYFGSRIVTDDIKEEDLEIEFSGYEFYIELSEDENVPVDSDSSLIYVSNSEYLMRRPTVMKAVTADPIPFDTREEPLVGNVLVPTRQAILDALNDGYFSAAESMVSNVETTRICNGNALPFLDESIIPNEEFIAKITASYAPEGLKNDSYTVLSGAPQHSLSYVTNKTKTTFIGLPSVLKDKAYNNYPKYSLKNLDFMWRPDLQTYYHVDLRMNIGAEYKHSIPFMKMFLDPLGLLTALDFDYYYLQSEIDKNGVIPFKLGNLTFDVAIDTRARIFGKVYLSSVGSAFYSNIVVIPPRDIIDEFLLNGFAHIATKTHPVCPWVILRVFHIEHVPQETIEDFVASSLAQKTPIPLYFLWCTFFYIYRFNISTDEFFNRVRRNFRVINREVYDRFIHNWPSTDESVVNKDDPPS